MIALYRLGLRVLSLDSEVVKMVEIKADQRPRLIMQLSF